MRKNLLFNIIQIIFFPLLIICFAYYYQIMNYEAMAVVLLILIVSFFITSFTKYPDNIPFSLFLITFFTFLLGRIVVTGILGYKKDMVGLFGTAFYDTQIIIEVLLLLFISLLFLFLGSFIKIQLNHNLIQSNYEEIKLVSKYIFLLSFVLRVFVLIEMIQGTNSQGYYEAFSSFRSSLPGGIVFLSEMYDISFFIFLGCMPYKKEALPFIYLYLVEGVLCLWSGRRSDFLLNVIILVLYVFYREYFSNKREKWISKKQILLGICILPIFFIILNIVGNLRRGDSLATNRVSESVLDFFFSQGISVNVLGYTINFRDSLPNKNYSFGPIIEFFKTRIFMSLTKTENFYVGQNVSRALEGNLFSHTISYYIMPDLYLRGIGYGSSYIAELFKDFSYIGLILGNLFYGFFLRNFYRFITRLNPYFKGIFFLMARQLMFAPRSSFTNFLVASLSLPKIFSVIVIFLMAYTLKKIGNNSKVKV
ncbi:hypothetical protein ATZ33_09705 [Enterococcus silesiacus]|uniref:O-antigen polysaccharide polymerase Wzy n=1 Tax=Enterococcus silesiacus TaxID=332949 RepID=A0ABM5W8S3_9ENTE|nr:O-antigen polysaccharide polymerase Wzy family protein [Enterococcus silesiacus]ALS01634.1 hypothetical protein ATZ33_09705 [Enterococcus silesiacus]